MNINWVLANNIKLDPAVDLDKLKSIGSLWGGLETWRTCQTDNVICNDSIQAQRLIEQNFFKRCNLYVPSDTSELLELPPQVKIYQGELKYKINCPEEIISMHLAANASDIVLLLGFNWTGINSDQQEIDYRGLVAATIATNTNTQWVLLDQPRQVRAELTKLSNFTQDTLINVLNMF